MKTSLISAGIVNFDQFCFSKLGRTDETRRLPMPGQLLIAFVAATWF